MFGVDDEDPFELVGDLIDGQFRVDSFVGFGDLSVVYRGFHIGVEANVAIKFLDLPTTLDDALVAPLVRSFREGTKLHYRLARGHMHIAQSIGSGQTVAPRTGAMVPYLVREWLEGLSLGHDFRERRTRGLTGRSLVEAVDLFRGALEGLAYAHRQGVPHLALNPSNLFLAQSGPEIRLKILDFGVAHAMNEHAGPIRARKSAPQQPTGLRVLVPAYAAPEQLDAAIGQPGTWTDVYAMALLFIEAMTDVPMFGDAPPNLDQALRPSARKITLPPDLEPRVAAVLERALKFAPRERQASAGIFWKDLSESLPTRTAAIVRRPSTSPKMPAMRRAPTLVGLNATPAPFRALTTRPPPPPDLPEKPSNRPPPPPPPRPSSVSTRPPPPLPARASKPAPQMRIATPIAEPMYIETIARAREAQLRQAPPPEMFAPQPWYDPSLPQFPPPPPMPADMAPHFTPMSSRSAETIAPPKFTPAEKKTVMIVGAVAGAIVLLVVVVLLASSAGRPSSVAKSIPIPTATPIATPTSTSMASASATPTPTLAQTISPTPTAPTSVATASNFAPTTTLAPRRRFTLNVGRAALAAVSETLADCKRPNGRFGTGSVRVTFSPDTGNVMHVLLGPPYSGSDQGKCIVQKYRAAHVEPFKGHPSAINYVFNFPR